MKIFVKFCGGCNPSYDREAFFERLTGMLAEKNIEFARYDETQYYDYGIVIRGCLRECFDLNPYRKNCKQILEVYSDNDFERIVKGVLSTCRNPYQKVYS